MCVPAAIREEKEKAREIEGSRLAIWIKMKTGGILTTAGKS